MPPASCRTSSYMRRTGMQAAASTHQWVIRRSGPASCTMIRWQSGGSPHGPRHLTHTISLKPPQCHTMHTVSAVGILPQDSGVLAGETAQPPPVTSIAEPWSYVSTWQPSNKHGTRPRHSSALAIPRCISPVAKVGFASKACCQRAPARCRSGEPKPQHPSVTVAEPN
jgi:hypothetical protein